MNLRLAWAGLAWLGVLGSAGGADPQPMPRKLAPGVVTVVPIAPQEEETFDGPLPLVEIVNAIDGLEWTPNYYSKTETLLEQSKLVVLRRGIWNLEFSFKPLRRINVDIPQATGKMQLKKIWYLVYRVKNIGEDLNPKASEAFQADPERSPETSVVDHVTHEKLRFFPHVVFSGQVLDQGRYISKDYLDRIIPAAQGPIQDRETPGAKLYNTVEITRVPVPLSDDKIDRSVWGVVTWEDIDPRIDFFSIYITGLTNAIKFVDPPGGYKKGQPPGSGRQITTKTLQLNFWRAGDAVAEHEEEIHYGVPLDSSPRRQAEIFQHYGITEPLDHRWLYR